MKILIATFDYPSYNNNAYPFVRQLVLQFASIGHECCVVSPYNISRKLSFHPFLTKENDITILRPNYLSLTDFEVFGFNPTVAMRMRAWRRAWKKLPFRPDVVYAHFWKSAKEAYEFAKAENIPLFVASGESTIPAKLFSAKDKPFFDFVSGVICVSNKNKQESIGLGLTTADKCDIFPNAINPKLFHPMDKTTCRLELGIPADAFVLAFCGQLSHRKGVKVLSDAIDMIQGKPVYSLFIGKPSGETPACRNILHQGPVPHDKIVTFLNAADIFVLPTLHEGCCNAIVEAMACGLPIVSSDRDFNHDILSSDNTILIEPTDSCQVADAIVKLRDDEILRKRLSDAALLKSKQLTLEERAKMIIGFMNSKILHDEDIAYQ